MNGLENNRSSLRTDYTYTDQLGHKFFPIMQNSTNQGHTCSVVRRTKRSGFNGKTPLVWSDGPQNKCDPANVVNAD